MSRSILVAAGVMLSAVIAGAAAAPVITKLMTPPVTARVTSASSAGAQIAFHLNDLAREEVWSEGERFDRFPFAGQPVAGPKGWPELPSVVKFVLIPPQSGVELKVTRVASHIIEGVNPYPRQPLPPDESPSAMQTAPFDRGAPLVRDARATEVDGFWPPEVATLERPAIMRGYRLVPVVFHPLRYDRRTRQLEVVDELEVALDYGSDRNRVNLVENPDRPRPSRFVRRIIADLVINPPLEEPGRDPGMRGGSILYVIGTGNNWDPVLDELTPLIEWRRRMGWSVDVLRVQSPNDPNATKQAIQGYYEEAENPPEHIVICGCGYDDRNRPFAFGYFNKQDGAAYPYESDHDFTTLEGDDILPEASVGRLIFDSTNRLRGIVNKTVQYESDPFIGEGDAANWQKRGAVEAVTSRSGLSSIDMCRWSKTVMMRSGFTQVNELYWGQQGDAQNRAFVFDNIDGGVSIFVHRGYLWMGQFGFGDVQQLRNGRMLPFVLISTCNTGDYGEHISDAGNGYFSESFSFHPNGGAIGAVGAAGATHTAYNNIYCTGALQALLNLGVTEQGWAHTAGKMALYTHYADRGDINHEENRNMEAWLTEFYIMNLMGDPAVDLFTDAPRQLDVTRPQAIRAGETRIVVTVLHDDDDTPAPEATVCLYKAGAFQLVSQPDGDGRVMFDLNPEWTQDGALKLTVSGHNLHTVLADYNVGQAEAFVGAGGFEIDDDGNGESIGNDDGDANQLETIELSVQIVNGGQSRPDGEMVVRLATDHPHLDVVGGEARFEAAPEVGEAATANFVVRIGGGFPSGSNAVFDVNTMAGRESWASSVSVPVVGPEIEFESLEWRADPLTRASSAELYLTIRNVSESDAPPLRATLVSRTRTVGAVVPEGQFEAIAAGQSARSAGLFRLSAHPFHLGGQPANLALALESDDGFQDTAFFSISVGRAVEGEPFGPDGYGYICFDNLDTSWMGVPTYEWIEIDPRHDGEGTNTDLRDGGDQQDQSTVVNLPFTFQYYGEDFNQITVSTNGWLAMGDHRQLLLARNRHIPGAENAPGMIAPFWDDLITPQNSGIYYWFDRDNDRFVVEWSRVKKYGPQGANEPEETFEVVLYDPERHPSFTGDGNIIFQYYGVDDSRSAFQEWDTPFATVGIASLDLTTGLEYTYWNARADGAAPLDSGLAVKFSTLVEFRTGALTGRVFDDWNGEPIAGVAINCTYGFYGQTDSTGEFLIGGMLVDSSYTIRASKRFYNDSLLTQIAIFENETTYVEFGLLHPEFTSSVEGEAFTMLADSVAERSFLITNSGNGQLWFTSRYGYDLGGRRGNGKHPPPTPSFNRRGGQAPPGRDEPDEMWDPLLLFRLSDSLQDTQIQGVTWVRDHWVVAGGNSGDSTNYFYWLDHQGHEINRVEQPIRNRYGLRDIEYWDGSLWAVSGSDNFLYQIDPETGDSIHTWPMAGRLRTPRCITVNPANGHFFMAGVTDAIYEMEIVDEANLRVVGSFNNADPRTNVGIRKSGLAWFRDDPTNHFLYIVGYNEVGDDTAHSDIAVYKMAPSTGEIIFLTDLAGLLPHSVGARGGVSITPKWDNRVWAMAFIFNEQVMDWFGVLELAPNSSWITYTPRSDTLQAGDATPIDLTIESADLDTGMYQILLDFTHNAAPGRQRIPIDLHVVYELPHDTDIVVVRDPLTQPLVFGLQPAYPNPFNATTMFGFTIEQSGLVRLRVYDLAGRYVATMMDGPMKAGRYRATFSAAGLPSGVYIVRLESGGQAAVRKMVMMK